MDGLDIVDVKEEEVEEVKEWDGKRKGEGKEGGDGGQKMGGERDGNNIHVDWNVAER